MGIQDASRKVKRPSQEPALWEGTVIHTIEVVHILVFQDRSDISKWFILELA